MPLDMPPKIPPAVIKYVKEHDYAADKYIKNINNEYAHYYINLYDKMYKGFNIYRLGSNTVKAVLSTNDSNYNYKGCYLLLYKPDEIRCTTKEEEDEIIRSNHDLSPSGFEPDIIDFVNNNFNYKTLTFFNADFYLYYAYLSNSPKLYQGKYYIYYLDFPDAKNLNGEYCRIIMQDCDSNNIRCATKDEGYKVLTTSAQVIKLGQHSYKIIEDYTVYRDFIEDNYKKKIPLEIIKYAKEHDFLPYEFEDITQDNAHYYIHTYNKKYKSFKIYRLGLNIDKIFISDNSTYLYKNCYLLLHNSKETRCATPEEEEKIVSADINLSPSEVPPAVVDYVNKYGRAPERFKNLTIFNADKYILHSTIKYENYDYYYLGFPEVYDYTDKRCQIVLHNSEETRCTTKREYYYIMNGGIYPYEHDI